MQVPFNPTEIFWYHFGTMLHTPPPHTHTHKKRLWPSSRLVLSEYYSDFNSENCTESIDLQSFIMSCYGIPSFGNLQHTIFLASTKLLGPIDAPGPLPKA
jgi:hypothetical protein